MTTKKKILSPSQKIKLHIKGVNNPIIAMLRAENTCNHQWQEYGFGFKCENCGYYTGHDLRLNQLINKLNKQK